MKATNEKGEKLKWYRVGLDDGFIGNPSATFYTGSSRRAYNRGYRKGIKIMETLLKKGAINEK